jgi:hypothetical protein
MVLKNTMLPIHHQKIHTQGFVILFSMLISSLILLIASGVFNLVQKELILSSYARESQFAFYSADAALECALFWDVSDFSMVAGGTPFILSPVGDQLDTISCNNQTIITQHLAGSGGTGDYAIPYVFRYPSVGAEDTKACSYVLVEKALFGGTGKEVRITAVGFNVCIEGESGNIDTPDFNDPRLLEQRISITYSTAL